MSEQPNAPVFRIENIIVKNLSLEMPASAVAPTLSKNPTVKMELRNASRRLSRDNYYEVTLEITFRVLNGEDVQLLIEAVQAGIVLLENADDQQREKVLRVHAPEMLYPYACQLLTDLMARAGAPRLFLPPFNFHTLQTQKREAEENIKNGNGNGNGNGSSNGKPKPS